MPAESVSAAAVSSEMATSAMASEPVSAATVPTPKAAMATATVPSDMATSTMAVAVRPRHCWLGAKGHCNHKQASHCQQNPLAHHSSPKKSVATLQTVAQQGRRACACYRA